MKISIQAVLDAVAAIYRAFFKGKTIKVGGQDVTLPNQKPTVFPSGQSPFDSTPHKLEPPNLGPRR